MQNVSRSEKRNDITSTAERTAAIQDTSVRRMLQNAQRCVELEEYSECMRYCCHALENLLTLRIEPIVRSVRKQWRWGDIGVRLLRTELGVRVQPGKSDYVLIECESCLDLVLLLWDTLFGSHGGHRLPRLSPLERMILRLQRLSRELLVSDMPLSRLRSRLQMLVNLRFALTRLMSVGRSYQQGQCATLGAIFHEPDQVMLSLLRSHTFHFEYNYARRMLHLNKRAEQAPYLQSFRWPERNSYRKFISHNSHSRVLVTIHMGDFLGAFNCIAALVDSCRDAISLRREQEEDKEFLVLENINHHIARHGLQNPVTIVSALRRGNVTLATLFDLQNDFGETVDVTFFGRPARFVKGPAQLAIMGKAPLLPFVTFDVNGVNQIDMDALIDTTPLPGESLSQATSRITQQLVSLAENWIRRAPDQWKYLDILPGYFVRGGDTNE